MEIAIIVLFVLLIAGDFFVANKDKQYQKKQALQARAKQNQLATFKECANYVVEEK